MKTYPHIAQRLFCNPWNILPSVHGSLVDQFLAHCETPRRLRSAADDHEGPEWSDGDPMHTQVTVIGDIAILPIKGILGKNLDDLEMMCGGCSYDVIAQQAKNIAADPFISTCILDIDSPGGDAIGNPECADTIADITRAGKSLVAWTDGKMASAAYMLACPAQEIWASPSSIVGSISTYLAVEDVSKKFEMEGREIRMFRTGSVKGAGTRGKPWTDAEIASMTETTDQVGAQFKDYVRARRPGVTEGDMQGQWWPAEFAPQALVNGLARDFEQFLALAIAK